MNSTTNYIISILTVITIVLSPAGVAEEDYRQKVNSKNKPKYVTKHEQRSSLNPLEQSLYGRIEKLRTLRMHNIMRNTKNYTSKEYKAIFSHTKKKISTSYEQPLSNKRKKVLEWEKIYN